MAPFNNSENVFRLNSHKLFVASFYLPLLYFQEQVNYYHVHYNVELFGKIPRYLSRYQLLQYRKIHPAEVYRREVPFVLNFSQNRFKVAKCPAHIRLVRYFFVAYLVRSATALVVRFKGGEKEGNRELRIWLGHEVMGADGLYIETTFLMWGVISLLFVCFTLSDCLLDYKFLALNSMTTKPGSPFHPQREFGLSERAYFRFARFRRGAFCYFHLISGSLTPMGCLCVVFLHVYSGLYWSHPVASVLYTAVHCYYIYLLVSVIYFNLVDFVIVAYYIYVKQSLVGNQMTMACNALTRSETLDARKASVVHLAEKNDVREISRSYPWELGKLLSVVRSFNRLLDEVADYNAFWRSFLSFVLVIYVLLISFIIYICVFGRAAVIVNAAYVQVLLFHIVSVGGILFFSGAVVRKNESIVGTVIAMVGRRSLAARRWPSESAVATTVLAHLKMHNLSQNLKAISSSGFCLLNGYLITHDTFRLLAVNILIYFLLVVGSTRKLDQEI